MCFNGFQTHQQTATRCFDAHHAFSEPAARAREDRYNCRMTDRNPTPSDPLRLNPEPLPKPKPEPTAADSDKTEPKKKRVKRKKH